MIDWSGDWLIDWSIDCLIFEPFLLVVKLNTVRDILSVTPIDLRNASLTRPEVDELLQSVAKIWWGSPLNYYRGLISYVLDVPSSMRVNPQQYLTNAFRSIVSAIPSPTHLSFGCPLLDQLFHGGIHPGQLTEFFGAAGSGKTQICLVLALRAQLPVLSGGLKGGMSAVLINCGIFWAWMIILINCGIFWAWMIILINCGIFWAWMIILIFFESFFFHWFLWFQSQFLSFFNFCFYRYISFWFMYLYWRVIIFKLILTETLYVCTEFFPSRRLKQMTDAMASSFPDSESGIIPSMDRIYIENLTTLVSIF